MFQRAAAGDLRGTNRDGPPPLSGARPSRRGLLFPPRWLRIVLGISAAVAIVSQLAALRHADHATANVAALVAVSVGLGSLAVWFVFGSGYPQWLRSSIGAGLLGAAGISAIVLRIDAVSGELVPRFQLCWAPRPDQLLLPIPAPAGGVSRLDLATSTEDDYPEFLGPNRRLRVDHVELDRDWSRHPPRLLWRQPIGAGWSAFSVVNGFAVTMEQRGEQELVTCYDARTGKLQWAAGWGKSRHSTTLGGVGPRATPTIHQGKVYTLGAQGTLLCVDGASGKVLWADNILQRYHVRPEEDGEAVGWGRAASPLVVDDLVIVPAGGPARGPHVSLAAFHKDTGQLAWEAGDRQVSYSSPVLAVLGGVRQVLIVNEDNVSAHDPRDGRILWSHEWPGKSNSSASVSQPAILDDKHVLLSKAYGGGAALLRISLRDGTWTANRVWHNSGLMKTKFTNVVVHGAYVYGLSDGILECIEWSRGVRQWKRGRYGPGQILGVRDLLLVQAESGDVALVEATPHAFRELGVLRRAVEGKTWNNLCLAGSLLLVRNAEEAACYELPIVSREP